MRKIYILLFLVLALPVWGQSSMRRCTLLPITDSVGGAVGFKVFEEVEKKLRRSNWCTYVSNSGLISVFSKYRENLPEHLKTKEVLSTVANRLKVGSLIRVGIINEIKGVEIQTEVYGENGLDVYFSEKILLNKDDVETISNTVSNWLNLYSKTIPYDAKINGILGDQLTLDVGKGYPVSAGQSFIVKRMVKKKKHPLLKKIVDWETEVLAHGSVFSISDNQAMGMVKVYKQDKKLLPGDWVRLEEEKQGVIEDKSLGKVEDETPGVLGVFSVALFGSSSSVDTTTSSGSQRMGGNIFGVDFRAEAWITRQYFAAIGILRSLGSMKASSGSPAKDTVNVNNGSFKLTGGYKYLPIGFFYGPQVDIYTGYANHSYDLDTSVEDGFGKHNISGLVAGVNVNIPLNRMFRFFAKAEFIPFPSFDDDDGIYGSSSNVSAMELEVGLKYNYTPRMSIDGSVETISRKAKFKEDYQEVSYKDNILKVGISYNF
jgi:hypothetical protein